MRVLKYVLAFAWLGENLSSSTANHILLVFLDVACFIDQDFRTVAFHGFGADKVPFCFAFVIYRAAAGVDCDVRVYFRLHV